MNTRIVVSSILLVLALVLVLVPKNQTKSGHLSPRQQLALFDHHSHLISVDKAAQHLNNQDPNVQFIDLRSKEEFLESSLPGAINITYADLFKKEWQGCIKQDEKTIVLYSNDNSESSLAQALCVNQGYSNIYILDGGLDAWFTVIMNSELKRTKLTARENAIYGNRLKARRLYTEINSLPDSLKTTILAAKLIEEEQLDGGCE